MGTPSDAASEHAGHRSPAVRHGGPEPQTAAELLALSQVDLYQAFRGSAPGHIPVGSGHGTPIVLPGTGAAKPIARALGTLVWRGKVFIPGRGEVRNLVSAFGVPAVTAKVRQEPSWFDGQPCIVLDYRPTSRLLGWVRDEMREVRPGLHLGLVYGIGRLFGGRRLLDVFFALSFPPPRRG